MTEPLTVADFVAEAHQAMHANHPAFGYERPHLDGFVRAAWPYGGSPADAAAEFVETVGRERGEWSDDA